MKGTITWLPIEDAPMDGVIVFLWCETESEVEYYPASYTKTGRPNIHWRVEPTKVHCGMYLNDEIIRGFCHINEPEVKS